jgi:hypothetical protein
MIIIFEALIVLSPTSSRKISWYCPFLVPLAQVNHLQGFKNTTFQKASSNPLKTQIFKK